MSILNQRPARPRPATRRLLPTSRFDIGTYITLTDGLQVGWQDGSVTSTYVRTDSTDALLMDAVTYGAGAVSTVLVKNLPAGRYSVTLYGYDTHYKDKVTHFDLDGNGDGTPDVSAVINNRSGDQSSATVSLDVSADGVLAITAQRELSGNNAAFNGFDIGPAEPDTTAPAAVADLAAPAVESNAVTLHWTAPADDLGAGGAVTSYDLRYSTDLIDAGNWSLATPVATNTPLQPGQTESLQVSGLSASTAYYFALVSSDSAGNVSDLSNVLNVTTAAPDLTAPAAVTDLATWDITPTSLTLAWTATGDDGNSGTAVAYDIRYSTTAIVDEATFAAAQPVPGTPAPLAAGTAQTLQVTSLTPDTTYYFAMEVTDDAGNVSALSNVAETTTLPPDTTPPAAVDTLAVTAATSSAVSLSWIAPADDNGVGGDAAAYDVRYSTSPITEANWASASQASGEPNPAAPGEPEAFSVAGLSFSTTYYFAVKSTDSSGNVSALSNVVWSETLAQALHSEVHVDVQAENCTTAAGYIAVTNKNRWDTGSYMDLGDGAQAAWTTAFAGNSRDRGTADALTRDFLLFEYGNPAQILQLRGIRPGTYDLKLYAFDPPYSDKQTQFNIDQNNDGTPDVSVSILTTSGEKIKTVQVTVSMDGILSIACSSPISGREGVFNGLDLTAVPDTFAPGSVADLSVPTTNSTQATLRWTTPADDNGNAGTVASYDVRYSTSQIDETNWSSAMQAMGEPTPLAPGQVQTFKVTDLSPATKYYFAVKSADIESNISPVSNVAEGTTQAADAVAPAAISDLEATAVDANQLTLKWTAPGDDGDTGTATAYNLRYSTTAITDQATFDAALPLAEVDTPKSAGESESFTVTGLSGSTTYWFAIRSADEMPNWSGLSNVLQVTTLPPDVTAPAAIDNLAVADVQSTMVTLEWTSPGDDGKVGTAVAYDVRYSTSPITDAGFATAQSAAFVHAPEQAGSTQTAMIGNLLPNTTYYFAIKTSDNGVPVNVSAISNVASVSTTAASSVAYGVTNELSLASTGVDSYAPAVATNGDISVTNIFADPAMIVRRVDRSGPVYKGVLHYDVTAPSPLVHAWLELSTDGGATWSERRIQAVGAVGTISPGPNKAVEWLVDGDHANNCRIRVRIDDNRATYSDLDADNNKMPRPVPWVHYPLLERLTDTKDFDLTNPIYELPKIDFYKSLTLGQVKAGFARTLFFNKTGGDQYFMHCCYLESQDGQQRYVILQGDTIYVTTDIIHGYRDQINAATGIPKDHIMMLFTHVHNGGSGAPGVSTFPMTVLQQAMANVQPVEVGFLNKDMGTSYNMNRNLLKDATHATSSFSNGVYDPDTAPAVLSIIWNYDDQGNIIGGLLDGTALNLPGQKYFDGPQDSYLQMIVFRNAETHAMDGVLVKFTGHPVEYDYPGDLPRCVMDKMQDRFGSNVEIMYSCGFGGNHRMLAAEHYPPELGSPRVANALADALQQALPTMEFKPLTKLGMVMGYDVFGQPNTSIQENGTDPDRLGTGVQVWRFNDIYLSTLPGEAPSQQGLYIRARTSDLKHMYTGYGNTYYDYYTFGRMFDVQAYEDQQSPKRQETFRMAQEVVRGVDILEQSVDDLHMSADINGDGYVNVGDLQALVIAWGSQGTPPTGNWNALADLNSDGYINVGDLLLLAANWGSHL